MVGSSSSHVVGPSQKEAASRDARDRASHPILAMPLLLLYCIASKLIISIQQNSLRGRSQHMVGVLGLDIPNNQTRPHPRMLHNHIHIHKPLDEKRPQPHPQPQTIGRKTPTTTSTSPNHWTKNAHNHIHIPKPLDEKRPQPGMSENSQHTE